MNWPTANLNRSAVNPSTYLISQATTKSSIKATVSIETMNNFFLTKGASDEARISLFQWIREKRDGGLESIVLFWDQQNQKIQAAYDSSPSQINLEISHDGSVLEWDILKNQLAPQRKYQTTPEKKYLG